MPFQFYFTEFYTFNMSTINTIREKKAYGNFHYNRMAAILKMAATGEWGKISRGSLSQIAQNTLLYMCTNFGAFMKKWTIHLKYQSMLLHYKNILKFYDGGTLYNFVKTCYIFYQLATSLT